MTHKQIKIQTIDPNIVDLAKKSDFNPEAILEIFGYLQEKRGNLDRSSIQDVASAIKIPPARAFGVASFYSMLNLTEPAKNVIRVCDGPVCWLCGAGDAHQAIEQNLAEQPAWKIERTSCLGLCDQAPALLINEEQAGPISFRKPSQDYPGLEGKAKRIQGNTQRRNPRNDGKCRDH